MLRQRRPANALPVLLAIFALGPPPAARADIDPEELQARSVLKDRQSQEKYRRQIEIDQAAERRRAAELALDAQRADAERRRAEAARPWPVRLTEQRCTLCHPATHYTRNGHALPGWWAVGLRMKYANEAPVSWEELQLIVTHLSELHPTSDADTRVEWLLFVGVLCILPAILGAGCLTRRLVKRRRS